MDIGDELYVITYCKYMFKQPNITMGHRKKKEMLCIYLKSRLCTHSVRKIPTVSSFQPILGRLRQFFRPPTYIFFWKKFLKFGTPLAGVVENMCCGLYDESGLPNGP